LHFGFATLQKRFATLQLPLLGVGASVCYADSPTGRKVSTPLACRALHGRRLGGRVLNKPPLTPKQREIIRKWTVNNLLARAALVAAKKSQSGRRDGQRDE